MSTNSTDSNISMISNNICPNINVASKLYSESFLVSSFEFYKKSKWSYCPYYGVNLNPQLFEVNDLVFLNLDYFTQFVDALTYTKPSNKFILIIHNSCNLFTNEHYTILYPITNHIYTINSFIFNSHVTCIPKGFIDNSIFPHKRLREILDDNKKKDILLYSNFLVNKNKLKRIDCLNAFIKKEWIYKQQKLPIEQYINHICRSKYILCPESITIDTYRIYLALYYNTIPIILNNHLLNNYISIPAIVTNLWKDITKEFLETNYEILYKQLIEWKNKNNNWTNVDFWLNKHG